MRLREFGSDIPSTHCTYEDACAYAMRFCVRCTGRGFLDKWRLNQAACFVSARRIAVGVKPQGAGRGRTCDPLRECAESCETRDTTPLRQVRISDPFGHLFRNHSDTHFGFIRTPVSDIRTPVSVMSDTSVRGWALDN